MVSKGELFDGASLICGLHCGLPPICVTINTVSCTYRNTYVNIVIM